MLKLRVTAEKCIWHLSAPSWKAFVQHAGSDAAYPCGLHKEVMPLPEHRQQGRPKRTCQPATWAVKRADEFWELWCEIPTVMFSARGLEENEDK